MSNEYRDGGPAALQLNAGLGAWQPIATVPRDTTVLLANYVARCLLTGAPHVWTATYVTKWVTFGGGSVEGKPMWCECSYAATNENGEPTHWMPLPAPPQSA